MNSPEDIYRAHTKRINHNSGSARLHLCVCHSRAPGITDGVHRIHTPMVQPSSLRSKAKRILKQDAGKTAGACCVCLCVPWLRTPFTANLIGFGATVTSKKPFKLLENKTLYKRRAQRRIQGNFTHTFNRNQSCDEPSQQIFSSGVTCFGMSQRTAGRVHVSFTARGWRYADKSSVRKEQNRAHSSSIRPRVI